MPQFSKATVVSSEVSSALLRAQFSCWPAGFTGIDQQRSTDPGPATSKKEWKKIRMFPSDLLPTIGFGQSFQSFTGRSLYRKTLLYRPSQMVTVLSPKIH